MKAQGVTPNYEVAARQFMSTPHRQRGAVMVLAAIAMVLLMGAAAFAIDSSHLLLNTTRAQNIVDITALSAAKTLQDTDGDKVEATADAIETFYASADDTGNHEITNAVVPADIFIEYSEKLDPFIDGAASPRFVRVRIENLPLQPWFIQIFGIGKVVDVSAVAGWTNIQVCEGLMPLMVCGCNPETTDCGDTFFGYEEGMLHSLKIASGDDTEVGPGNAQLLNLPGLNGCNDLRAAAAGGFNECLSGVIDTKPGQCAGPLRQGLNLRFGESTGPLDPSVYLPDYYLNHPDDNPANAGVNLADDGTLTQTQGGVPVVITEPGQIIGTDGPYDHDGYEALYGSNGSWVPDTGRYKRREVRVVIGDCINTTNGRGPVEVLGFGCYYLTQPVRNPAGGTGNQSFVIGEFFHGCPGSGVVTEEETGVNKIVLFKDVGSDDS